MMIRRIFLLLAFMPLLASAQNQILPPIGGGSGGGVTQQAVTDTLNKNIPRSSTSIDTLNRLLPGWKGQTVTTPGAITMTDGSLTASIGNVTSVAGMVQGYQGVFDSTLIKCGTDMSKQSTASIGAYGSQTNISVSIQPKGTGAFYLGPKADGTTTGGNARGEYAIDLQLSRGAATNVASGNYSIVAGQSSTASGVNSIAIGLGCIASGDAGATAIGRYATASNTYAIAIGTDNTVASGYASLALGRARTASGNYSAALGYATTASGATSTSLGTNSTASGISSTVMGDGSRANHSNEVSAGMNAWGDNLGKSQRSEMHLADTTNGAVADTLTLNYTENGTMNNARCMTIDSGFVWTYSALVSARSDVGDAASFKVEGGIQRVGATTSMIGSPTITTLGATANATTWTVTAVADDTNDALHILVTGAANKYIRWHSTVTISMVGF